MNKEDILKRLKEAIIDGQVQETEKAVEEAIKLGMSVNEIISDGMNKGMDFVGEKFACKEFFLPELMLAAKAMTAGVEVLQPHIGKMGGEKTEGTIVIGSVEGDVHNIGKNLVTAFLKSSGFTVFDLGENVSAQKFIEAALSHKADIIGFSVFCSACANEPKKVDEALRKAGIRERVRTMAGGCVLSKEDAQRMGADGYGKDAFEAVKMAKSFIKELRTLS